MPHRPRTERTLHDTAIAAEGSTAPFPLARKESRGTRFLLAAVLSFLTSAALATAGDAAKHFDIRQQSLASALNEFARQSDRQILFSTETAESKRTDGVTGDLAPDAALKVLLKGTGLTYRTTSDNTILVEHPRAGEPADTSKSYGQGGKDKSAGPLRLAQTEEQGSPAFGDGAERAGSSVPAHDSTPQLQEVVVTGSRIPRTTQEGAQEVKIYAKEQIEQSGQTTVSDFLNTLPDVSVAVGEQGLRTQSGGTTVQLHGLPVGTTLVLINGRRVESSAVQVFTGPIVDLNLLPLSAVERIEVLPEGASAIYGSDAIAGVVNVV
ncbi:MAG: TonB-dependent receptor, partial [Gammaproteobacteria bacterium]|nr:TonB-dependent receptor [Gammaproteobacteria bacterium]